MSDERLRETLRSLPRERAGEGFTAAVLARLPREGRRRPAATRLAFAALAAAAGVALLVTVLPGRDGSAPIPLSGPPDATIGALPAPTADSPASRIAALPAPEREPASGTGAPAAPQDDAPPAAGAPPPRPAPARGRRALPPAPRAVPPAQAAAPAAVRLAALREEQHRLADELAALRRLAAGEPPVVYLGGDEATDLVLDLVSLAHRRPVDRARPAVYDGGGAL